MVEVARLVEEKTKTAKKIVPEWAKPVKDWLGELVSLAQSDEVSEDDFRGFLENALDDVPGLLMNSDVLEESLWDAQATAYKMGWEVYEESETVEAGKSSGRGIPCGFSYIAPNKVCRVNRLIDGAISGNSGNVKIGKLTKRATRRYQSFVPIGHKKDDFSVYEASISPSSVNHIRKKHGSPKEYNRGQVPIEKGDFYNIPKIIRDPSTIKISEEKGIVGQVRFEISKKINNVRYVAVVEQVKKKRTISLVTMWKMPEK